MNFNYSNYENQWDDTFDADDSSDGGEDNLQTVMYECMEKFRSPDYIMEPGIFVQLKRYFQAGGNPEQVIHLLSNNYVAIAQMVNLIADWLILAGSSITEVQGLVENHLKEMICKNFDPKKADTIFTEEGKTPAWLPAMIKHHTWRTLIYKLAEEYPDCLMLNFTIKLISDAGYQAEITSISTAAQQMEVFSSVLKTAIGKFLNATGEEQARHIADCARMATHGQHTYVYSSMLFNIISQEGRSASCIKRLHQEITKVARQKNDVTAIEMALNGAAKYPQTAQALSSMLSRNTLNPADISVLYRQYSSPETPPIDLIRNPQLLELLIDSLFKPSAKLNPEHKSKYIYVLAFACSVYEVVGCKKTGSRRFLNKDELKQTMQAIDDVHTICITNKGSTELIYELGTLFKYIKFPVVAIGIIRWIEHTVTEPSYFKLCTEHTPTHLVLLDEIVSTNFLLHSMVLQIFITLFETKHSDLDVLVQLEIKKMLIDRMVNLLCHGCVVPVVKYIEECWKKTNTDISLIRYFVTEVLETISPPYSREFASLFLPIVENDEVTGTMRCGDGDNDPVSEFIVHCKGMGL